MSQHIRIAIPPAMIGGSFISRLYENQTNYDLLHIIFCQEAVRFMRLLLKKGFQLRIDSKISPVLEFRVPPNSNQELHDTPAYIVCFTDRLKTLIQHSSTDNVSIELNLPINELAQKAILAFAGVKNKTELFDYYFQLDNAQNFCNMFEQYIIN